MNKEDILLKRQISEWIEKESHYTFQYHRTNLTETVKNVYDLFFSAFSSFGSFCLLSTFDLSACNEAYEACIFDNPLLFYVNRVSFFNSPLGIYAKISYISSEKELSAIWKEMDRIIQLVRSKCYGKSELNKEILIHNTLVRKLGYKSSEKMPVHSSYSAFMYRKAVCDGISKMTKILMDAVGIPTIIVIGGSNHEANQYGNPTNKINHAWNMVKIEGEFYHLDLTFDLNLSENELIRYDYFNLTDEQISRDHSFSLPIKSTTHIKDYYSNNGKFFTNKMRLKSYLINEINRGERNIVFKLPYTVNGEYTYKVISAIIKEALLESTRNIREYYTSYNKEQMIIYIRL